ncbi:MAG: hypothetical protein CMK59_09510 [Proteobacteria bacterium]|nr:hypothetical protein [Pseudomonadota bacterium]
MKRLDRLIAERTGFGRKECAKLIRQGRVRVRGDVVLNRAVKCAEDEIISIDEHIVEALPRIVVFHKPAGMLSTAEDPMGRECVGDVLPHRFHLVGRLDMETRGLILFSSDGALTQWLLHPKRAYEREYWAEVDGTPSEDLKIQLEQGVQTGVGLAKGRLIEQGDNWVRLIMTEGKNRIVRRMLNNVGLPVVDLFRLRFGPFELNDLSEGEIRTASFDELQQLEK